MIRRKAKNPGHLQDRRCAEQPGIPPPTPRDCEALEKCHRKPFPFKGMGAGGDQVCDAERR